VPARPLILIPTALERERLRDQGGIDPARARVEVCGFGPVASAARTAQLLARERPERVILIGIAGAYDVERHPPGTALVFARTAIDGVGAGEAERFRGPPELGFPQWPGAPDEPDGPGAARAIHDELALHLPAGVPDELRADLLLTTCAASDGPEHAARRRARFPEAVAEDMEAFAVALACALFGLELEVVRGISNRVGDRDPKHWRIPSALGAARRALLEGVLRA
jgi:futalosine hydrolase